MSMHRAPYVPGDEVTPKEQLFAAVELELVEALAKFPSFHSPHEGYAVILEELEELWTLVQSNRGRDQIAREEAIQVAAMAIRYVFDLCLET